MITIYEFYLGITCLRVSINFFLMNTELGFAFYSVVGAGASSCEGPCEAGTLVLVYQACFLSPGSLVRKG